MLEDLDTIPWETLRHAYGVASNIPERIRAVASSRGAAQIAAINELGNDICHQGSACSATIPCIPFICEIIADERMPQRHRLVSLLQTIAIGLDDDLLHEGIRIADYQAQQQQEADDWPAHKKRPTSWGPFLWLDCYSTVERIVPELLYLLDDKDRLVRLHAQYLFAWFPKHREKTLAPLRRSMETAKRWEELANAILCVGLLEWQALVKRTSDPFVLPLLDDRRKEVRFAAAIYCSWHEPTDQVRDILHELSICDDYDGNAPIPFNGYDWADFARQQLAHVWVESDEVE